jgi:murein DD-endopeptidase MepM/ murein hydrolase activator NlpD
VVDGANVKLYLCSVRAEGSDFFFMPKRAVLRWTALVLALIGAAGAGVADYDPSGGPGQYTVLAGDSLWAIATRHGLTVAQLAAANHLNPDDILPIGKVLVLPDPSASATPGSQVSAGPWSFCSTFVPERGPWGELPAGLAGSAVYQQLEPLFARWASQYGLSQPLLEAIAWQESGWQQSVVSATGAVGVGQIEPYTAAFIESDLVGQPLDINSVSDNIRMEAAFLLYLARVERDNTCATIAAYYEGPIHLQTEGVIPSAQQYVADVEYLESDFS